MTDHNTEKLEEVKAWVSKLPVDELIEAKNAIDRSLLDRLAGYRDSLQAQIDADMKRVVEIKDFMSKAF